MCEKILCSRVDSIEILGLNVRFRNALKRAGIVSIADLLELRSRGEDLLFAVRNLGEMGVAEIQERLGRIKLLDAPPLLHDNDKSNELSEQPKILIDLGPPLLPKHEVVLWQQMMVKRQIQTRLLHPQIEVDGRKLSELVDCNRHADGLYERLTRILTAPINVSQELEELLKSVPPREIDILVRRFGFERQTLEEVAEVIGVTRERIRQLQRQATSRILPVAAARLLARTWSAVLFANDFHLSFDEWSRRLVSTGLLGEWTKEEHLDYGNLELMLVVCTVLAAEGQIEIPEELTHMLELRKAGMSAAPARMNVLLNDFRGETERLVRRHLRYSGAVSVDWLLRQDEVRLCENDLRSVLALDGYTALDKDWFMSPAYEPAKLHKNSVVHRSLAKMFQFCGPLGINDIYFGIEHTVSRTTFPVPPVPVLEYALDSYGYDSEKGLWYWNGNKYETLNTGENIIMHALKRNGGVVHHQQLAEAFLESSLSFPSLHGTLSRSPLFDNFERSLYKLRGTAPRQEAIEQARQAAERIPVDLQVEYDMDANIIVEATLGVLAVGNGTILSENLPNLEGDWDCALSARKMTDIYVTENEIRRLGPVLKNLACEVGDRVRLVFNTESRQVTASRKEGFNDNGR